jgi:hypothetical protein
MSRCGTAAVSRGILTLAIVSLVGCATPPRRALEPADRSPSGGREAYVLVSQGEIHAAINRSAAGAVLGGGLLGALIDTSVNQHRTNKAEETVKSLRDALNGYNFDQRAVQATQSALAGLDWLGAKQVSFSKDVSDDSRNACLDKAQAPEVLFATYDYSLTADFSAVEVSVTVTIDARKIPPGGSAKDRIKTANAAYTQAFTSLVPLANATKEAPDNMQRWAADNARLARVALDAALGRDTQLIQRSLSQTPQDAAKLDKGAHVSEHGIAGKLIEKDDNGTLLIEPIGTWVYISTTPVG